MSTKAEAKKVGKKVVAALSDRKGFDWWFDDLDSYIKTEIYIAVGEAAIKAVKVDA